MIELLAPAGSREAMAAAVESGANAIYLAGNMFGARAYASNFDREALVDAIHFAHLRDVHIHVTVNTIIADQEFDALADYLRFLYEAGADAILVQDLGVARLARKIVPNLPLHASTQMTVHNLAGVLALEKLGFRRVVLSRELSLKDIRYICQNSHVEIEVFGHGALCVCYSGQCLMSSMIGGRSGNRGRCAQPCRLPYTLVDENGQDVLAEQAGKYLLSPRDMNTIDILPEIIESGVTSLKIEGRMKRPEYVAVVVDIYRRAIDSYLSGDGYRVSAQDRKNLAQIFNRDFTTAYLEGRPGKTMMSDRRPNNRGLLVGRVVRYDWEQHRVTVKLTGAVSEGDEVDFWVKVGGRVNGTIHDMADRAGQRISSADSGMEISFPLASVVHGHDRVFKVFDAALMTYARSFFNTGAPVRRIPLQAVVRVSVGEPMTIELTDADGYKASAATNFIGESARKRPLSEETIRKQLSRMGTTVFELQSLQTDIAGNVMVPVSEINDARRRATEQLAAARLAKYARPSLSALENVNISVPRGRSKEQRCQLFVAVDSVESMQAALAAGADGILFGGDSYKHKPITVSAYQQAWTLAKKRGCWLGFNTERILTERQIPGFKKLLEALRDFPPDAVYVHNIGILSLVQELTDFAVWVDYSLIAYNQQSIAFLHELGAVGVTLSPELTIAQVERLAEKSSLPVECIVHGRLELMVSEYCVTGSFLGACDQGSCTQPCSKNHKQYSLLDRKEEHFPLVMDAACHMHILNGKTLSMLPHAMKFKAMGVERMRIEGRFMSSDALAALVRAYKQFMLLPEQLTDEQKDLARRIEGSDCTRGHYFRGVL